MATITIPKELIRERDLVVIPRKEYEEFLRVRKEGKTAVKNAVNEGLRDLNEGRVSPIFSSAKAAIRHLHRQAKKLRQSK